MKTFVFFADKPNNRRSDRMNTVVALGIDEAAARNQARKLLGSGIAAFKAVELTDSTPPIVIEGGSPISYMGQAVFPSITRGGNRLRAIPDAS